MPSIKLLKKEINNDIGDFIEEIYLWELSNPNGDLIKSENLECRLSNANKSLMI